MILTRKMVKDFNSAATDFGEVIAKLIQRLDKNEFSKDERPPVWVRNDQELLDSYNQYTNVLNSILLVLTRSHKEASQTRKDLSRLRERYTRLAQLAQSKGFDLSLINHTGDLTTADKYL